MKIRQVFQVRYEVILEVDSLDELDDAVSNIDIPEGGANDAVYMDNSFQPIGYDIESE